MLECRVQISADVRDDAEILLDSTDERRPVASHAECATEEAFRLGTVSRLELESTQGVECLRGECLIANAAGDLQTPHAQITCDLALQLPVHHDAQSPGGCRVRRRIILR